MLRFTGVLAVALLASLLFVGSVWAQGGGVVEGQVLSATADDTPIVGALVTLRSWQTGEELPSQDVRTDEDGQFFFSGLEVLDHEYQLLVGHQNVTYAFARKGFLPEETRITVPLTVYDTTNDDSILMVERAHLIIDGDGEHLHIQEVHVLTNTSLSVYAPTDLEIGKGELRFLLPTGAANLEWLGGFPLESVAISETGFNIDAPFLPGTVEVTFSYTLPFSVSPYVVEKIFPYAVSHLDVFVTATGIEAAASQLVRGDPIAMPAGHYNRFSSDELPAGTSVAIEFEWPESQQVTPVASPAGGSGTTTVIVIVVVVVLVLVVLVYPFIRRGRRKTG